MKTLLTAHGLQWSQAIGVDLLVLKALSLTEITLTLQR